MKYALRVTLLTVALPVHLGCSSESAPSSPGSDASAIDDATSVVDGGAPPDANGALDAATSAAEGAAEATTPSLDGGSSDAPEASGDGSIPIGAISMQAMQALALGTGHTCVLDTTGAAYCWGDNAKKQLGTGSTSAVDATPKPVATAVRFKAIAAGDGHTCALDLNGAAHCWGSDDYGQIGNGARDVPQPPTPVQGGRAFVDVTAGPNHNCAVTADGDAYCWGGRNATSGVLGDGTLEERFVPTLVAGGHKWSLVRGSYGLTTMGAGYAWGANAGGQLGIGAVDGMTHSTPEPLAGNLVMTTLAAGAGHGCGADKQGLAYCWGQDDGEQLGNGQDAGNISAPGPVEGMKAFALLTAGTRHSCALNLQGAAFCWGSNVRGNLGDGILGSPPGRNAPYPVSGGRTFVAIQAGGHHTCAVDGTGKLFCWGSNATGELGGGVAENNNHTMPIAVAPSLTILR